LVHAGKYGTEDKNTDNKRTEHNPENGNNAKQKNEVGLFYIAPDPKWYLWTCFLVN